MKNSLLLRIGLILLIIFDVDMSILAQKMPETCNDLYMKFSKSIDGSNLKDLESVMYPSTMVRMKNEALSMGMDYPKDFFEGMKMALLDFKDFKYITNKKQGPTTNVYYMWGENGSESNIITICLIEENGKYTIEQFKIRDAKDFILNLHNKDYSFLDLPEFRPSGVIPVTPKTVEKIDYVANVDIIAYGYKVSVTVNGFFQDEITNTTKSGVLIGGVKKGENTVEINVEKVDKTEKDNPAVVIRALVNGEEKEVFVIYEEMSGKVSRTFTVQ